jgi:hypothetical protein
MLLKQPGRRAVRMIANEESSTIDLTQFEAIA